MTTGLAFDPLLPWPVLWAACAAALLLAGWLIVRRARGAWARAGLLAVLIALLSGPLLVRETRESLDDIAVLLVDRTASQGLGERTAQTDAAAADLSARLSALGGLEVRTVEVTGAREDGTHLFSALDAALADTDRSRVAGAIMVTDGAVHDVPDAPGALGFPVHALVTGEEGERDRALTLVTAPGFGIVGEPLALTVRVEDHGLPARGITRVTIRVDGEIRAEQPVRIGTETTVFAPIDHAGPTAVELSVPEIEGEITAVNNRAALVVNGVRDRLRVLLVSGEPYLGERVWRNLLKADPSVDLVHFTILRPPEKQDGTPIRELSLIAFPTRELFSTKLHEFDLIIFDRYRRRGVLPMLYLDNIAGYVERGGALLIATGPAYAGPSSLHRTPVAAILPSAPTGREMQGGFRPQVTDTGRRHPVTQPLSPPVGAEPGWGRWFRLIEADALAGEVLMSAAPEGAGERPLLILDRVGEGRVAQLLSDQAWLWARGYEGGGPQAELLRRLSHWLMQEPDLEEERISATRAGDAIAIERHTMADTAPPAEVTLPSGEVVEVPLTQDPTAPGTWRGSLPIEAFGLYRFASGEARTVLAVATLNPKEFASPISTLETLAPVARATGGGLQRASEGVPALRRVAEGRAPSGSAGPAGWFGLVERDRYRVTDVRETPLLPPSLAMALAIALAMVCWRVEGR